MKKGFNDEGFMAYVEYQFPGVFSRSGGSFTRELLENLIEYAHKHEQVGKDQFCDFLSSLLPEMEMGEVAAFMEDDCLTASYGIAEKRRVMEERDIRVEVTDGVTHVLVGGEALYLWKSRKPRSPISSSCWKLRTDTPTIISKSCLAARSGLFFPRISLAVMQCECGATTTSRFTPSKPAFRSTSRRRMWHENPQVCL